MSSTVSQLMHQSLASVSGERDDARRTASAERTYAADISSTDPEGVVEGGEAVEYEVCALLTGAPDFVFQAPVVPGTDIALTRDGRISALHTVLDA